VSAGNFHSVPKVPDSVAHLDPNVVVEVLSRHGVNVTEAADELGVASADLRRLLWARPQLSDTAAEIEERRLDLAEKNIYEALRSDDPRRRDAASMFTIRNSAGARRRGWITSSTSAAELSVTAAAPARTLTFRCEPPKMMSATPSAPRPSGCSIREGRSLLSAGRSRPAVRTRTEVTALAPRLKGVMVRA
jgi:hypothetical protein